MGRKLVRDFVPGMRLASEGPINGQIRTVANVEEAQLLGAEKVVEEALELLTEVKKYPSAHTCKEQDAIRRAIARELGDVFQILHYTAEQFELCIAEAATDKCESHGAFTKNFVWVWDGDKKPRTIGADNRIHDDKNATCPWNCHEDARAFGCTCPKE